MDDLIPPDSDTTLAGYCRDPGLLLWDETPRRTSLTPLAQQLSSVLGVFNTAPQGPDGDSDLASLLSQVVGAEQLGTLDAAQVQLLQTLAAPEHLLADVLAHAVAPLMRPPMHCSM